MKDSKVRLFQLCWYAHCMLYVLFLSLRLSISITPVSCLYSHHFPGDLLGLLPLQISSIYYHVINYLFSLGCLATQWKSLSSSLQFLLLLIHSEANIFFLVSTCTIFLKHSEPTESLKPLSPLLSLTYVLPISVFFKWIVAGVYISSCEISSG